jgi:hypothetical protein
MPDLIDRGKLIDALEALKKGWAVADRVLERVIELVKAQPAAGVKKETFLDWRSAAADKEKKRKAALIPIYDIIEHTESGLLEED